MKIEKIRLSHFGKFSNREVEFTDGLNIIEGSNEAGKSTIHAFIRGILFGINKGRGKAAKGDAYTRFQPWDTPGAYQGSMDFEHEGKHYHLSRVFLQQQKSASLTETETGKTIEMGDLGVTALIPELTPVAYDNTVNCSQLHIRTADDFGTYVKGYAANLAGAGDASVDVTGAVSALDQRVLKTRQILKNLDVEHIKAELDSLYEDEKDEKYVTEDRDKVLAVKESLVDELNREESALKGIAVPSAQYESVAGEYERLELDRKEIEESAGKTELLKIRVREKEDRAKDCSDKLEKVKIDLEDAGNKANELRGKLPSSEDVKKAEMKREQASSEYEKLREQSEKNEKKDSKLKLTAGMLLACGLAAACISGERFKIGIVLGLIMMAAGLVTLVFAIVSAVELKKLKETLDAALDLLHNSEAEVRDITGRSIQAKETLEKAEREKQEKELAYRDAAATLKELEVEGLNLRERINEAEEEYRARIAGLNERAEKLAKKLVSDGIFQEDKGVFYTSGGEPLDMETLPGKPDEKRTVALSPAERLRDKARDTAREEERITERIKVLKTQIAETEKELSRMEGVLSQYGDIGERIDEAEKKLADAKEKRDEAEFLIRAAELAKSEIERISADLRSGFEKVINKNLSEECALTTNGKYTQARLDAKFGIEVMDEADFVSVDSLSTGTQEQLYMALRLAVARMFFGDMPIPLLFDESFAHYDDIRMKSVLTALSKQTSRQILIFTCNGQEREMLDSLGAKYNPVRL
ncbi:MAG: AAA family ATPase [Lachnospiraceae bacterium]|nr:AAA family ATPase [Lachnospiraceae bacterium]